jgi:hypothetical protein
MVRRRDLDEIINGPGRQREGVMHALRHASFMKDNGLLSEREAKALQRYFAAQIFDTAHGEELDRMMDSGEVDRLQELGGYDDDTADPDGEDQFRHEAGSKVVIHFFSDAAARGIIEPEQALEILGKYIQVPEGDDPREIVRSLLSMVSKARQDEPPEKSDDERLADYTKNYDRKRSRR